ncbi:Nse4 C-terminal-domain-containing protein [Syncephalastrum racemosum]|uniref:Non-structural maintenance of chromosomes element 4 n=1 Tax=Syncephalastrum racemosum TaxID=13706 RepID=A0A1X2H370_SYNRA|nr:Nse4 C-terminal-domain-containing protein [Syncephalastrum racemosum]
MALSESGEASSSRAVREQPSYSEEEEEEEDEEAMHSAEEHLSIEADEEEDENDQDDEEEEEIDPDYDTLTQQINQNTDRKKYDPSQDKAERRAVRKAYRNLISNTEGHRRDFTQTKNKGLQETLLKADDIFSKVRNPTEATLDSRLLTLAAEIQTQKARNMRLDFQLFSVDEFVTKVASFGSGDLEDAFEERELDWKKIGMRSATYGKRAHSMDFMLGPLSVEKKQRKITRSVRLVKNKEDLVQPDKLEGGDLQQQENETSKNVSKIYQILDDHGPVNYLEFITNPESFSQTVENTFYVSFLIRTGVAQIDDSSGQPMLNTCEKPSANELAEGLSRTQKVINIDMALWKSIIETYGIRTSLIPTRPKQQAMGTGKWY